LLVGFCLIATQGAVLCHRAVFEPSKNRNCDLEFRLLQDALFFGSMQRFLLDSSIPYTSPLAYLTVPTPGERSELEAHLKPHPNHLYTPTRSLWQRQTAITVVRSAPITCISLWLCNLYLPPCNSRDEYPNYAGSPHLLQLSQEFVTLFTRTNKSSLATAA